MHKFGRYVSPLLLLVFALQGIAQIPGLSSGEPARPDAPADPLGRSTPRGTIVGFSRAVERKEFATAALYLQLDPAQQRAAPELARQLKRLIDRELREAITRISDLPDGTQEDGLPMNRERVGPLVIGGSPRFIQLVRVDSSPGESIWLVSAETLKVVPAIASISDEIWIETVMPKSLLARGLLGLSLAHWIVLLGVLLGTFASLVLIGKLIDFIARQVVGDAARRRSWDAWYEATRWPAISALTLVVQFLSIPSLGFPLTFRMAYARVGLVALVIALTWLLKRSLTLAFAQARLLVRGNDRASTQSLMLLAERMVKAALFVVAMVAVLILLGVESKTALAALGVLGVALALGAQKTVENLLGGIFLLSDKALAVGDYCTIGNQSGTVEDVTLRSVRLRTPQQSLVSLPAGSLAQAGIENFASRRKMLVLTTLRLRYGTGVHQLREILDGTRALLTGDALVEKESAYVRLVNFGAEAIELELFFYLLTADAEGFRAQRENLLLGIAAIVESAGSALAPTRFVQFDPAPAPLKQ